MKQPSFGQGVLAAAVLAFLASILVATLTPFVGLGAVLRIVIPIVTLLYLLYVLHGSEERIGRVTALSIWAALAVSIWWLDIALPMYLLIHVGSIWLIRCLYHYSSTLPALVDFGLNTLSLCTAVWAISRTGSVFLATWSFFLIQALFVAIPRGIPTTSNRHANTSNNADRFTQAQREADRALQQLFSQ